MDPDQDGFRKAWGLPPLCECGRLCGVCQSRNKELLLYHCRTSSCKFFTPCPPTAPKQPRVFASVPGEPCACGFPSKLWLDTTASSSAGSRMYNFVCGCSNADRTKGCNYRWPAYLVPSTGEVRPLPAAERLAEQIEATLAAAAAATCSCSSASSDAPPVRAYVAVRVDLREAPGSTPPTPHASTARAAAVDVAAMEEAETDADDKSGPEVVILPSPRRTRAHTRRSKQKAARMTDEDEDEGRDEEMAPRRSGKKASRPPRRQYTIHYRDHDDSDDDNDDDDDDDEVIILPSPPRRHTIRCDDSDDEVVVLPSPRRAPPDPHSALAPFCGRVYMQCSGCTEVGHVRWCELWHSDYAAKAGEWAAAAAGPALAPARVDILEAQLVSSDRSKLVDRLAMGISKLGSHVGNTVGSTSAPSATPAASSSAAAAAAASGTSPAHNLPTAPPPPPAGPFLLKCMTCRAPVYCCVQSSSSGVGTPGTGKRKKRDKKRAAAADRPWLYVCKGCQATQKFPNWAAVAKAAGLFVPPPPPPPRSLARPGAAASSSAGVSALGSTPAGASQGSVEFHVDATTLQLLQRLFDVPADQRHSIGGGRDQLIPVMGYDSLEVVRAWKVRNASKEKAYADFRKEQLVTAHALAAAAPGARALQPWQVDLRPEFAAAGSELLRDSPFYRNTPPLDASINEVLLVHGTKPEHMHSILFEGLDPRHAGRSILGYTRACFLAEDAAKSDQYLTRDVDYAGSHLPAAAAAAAASSTHSRVRPSSSSEAVQLLHDKLYPNKDDHPQNVYYAFVCRTVLGPAPVPTLDANYNSQTGKLIFQAVPGSRTSERVLRPEYRAHALVIGTGQALKRFREFVVFEAPAIQIEFVVALKRVRKYCGQCGLTLERRLISKQGSKYKGRHQISNSLLGQGCHHTHRCPPLWRALPECDCGETAYARTQADGTKVYICGNADTRRLYFKMRQDPLAAILDPPSFCSFAERAVGM